MDINHEQLQRINKIRILQQELEQDGLDETSEILKLAVISLFSQFKGISDFEDLLLEDYKAEIYSS